MKPVTITRSWTPPINEPVNSFLARIGPEAAAYILENFNAKNRPMVFGYVKRYAQAMEAGQWMDGSEIGFDSDGFLDAGQKRLQAVIDSGTTQIFIVTTGRDPAMREVVDGGQPASAANVLEMRKFKVPAHLQGVLSTPSRFTALATQVIALGKPMPHSLYAPSRAEQVEWVMEHAHEISAEQVNLARGISNELGAAFPLIFGFMFRYPEFTPDFEHLLALAQNTDTVHPGSDPMAALKRWYTDRMSHAIQRGGRNVLEAKAIARTLGAIKKGETLTGARAVWIKNGTGLSSLLKILEK